MASSLLRKSRSIIQRNDAAAAAAHVSKHDTPPLVPQKEASPGFLVQITNFKNRRKSRIDLSTAVESEQSVAARQKREQKLRQHSSISQLHRRLVRKASTFNLHRTNPGKVLDTSSSTRSEHLFPDNPDDELSTYTSIQAHPSSPSDNIGRPSTASSTYSEAAETILYPSTSPSPSAPKTDHSSVCSRLTAIPARRHTLPDSSRNSDKFLSSTQSASRVCDRDIVLPSLFQAQADLVALHPEYRERHIDRFGVWVKMATAAAQPPLPYDNLKQITIEACETALSDNKAYEHSKTETWNTTIINEILSRLVGESTAATTNGSSTSQQQQQQTPQSQWKFVVNSTIIQHRSSDEAKPARRGMHAAAGAYWNNEKDGMWSFKYEAAERMGLDVIVGIVWVWVG